MKQSWIDRFRTSNPRGLRLFVIGSQGAGKTCFLGGLALLTDAAHHSPFQLVGMPDEDGGGGNASMEFLNDIGAILRSQEWPQATVSTLLLRYELRFNGFISKLDILDYPGEEMQSALNSLAPSRLNKFAEDLCSSTHILVLVDPIIDLQINGDNAGLKQLSNEQIYQRLSAPINALNWCISKRDNGASPPHIGLVITKADLVPDLLSNKGCDNLRSELFNILRNRLASLAKDQVEVFAITSVGSVSVTKDINVQGDVTQRTIPGGVDGLRPQGYESLFQWIFRRQLRVQQWHKIKLTAAVTLLLITILSFFGWIEYSKIRQIEDKLSPVSKRTQACEGVWTSWGCDARHRFISAELENVRSKSNALGRYEDCEPLLEILSTLKKVADSRESSYIDNLDVIVAGRKQELEFAGINEMPDGPAKEDRLRSFVAAYPETDYARVVREMLTKVVDKRMTEQRNLLARSYTLLTLADFGAKATAMEKYVEESGDKVPDRESVLKAAKVARRLATSGGAFELKISGFSGLSKPMYHYVNIISGSDSITYNDPPQKTSETNDSIVRVVKWRPNDPVRVEVKVDVGWVFADWAVPAAREVRTPLSIALLGQGRIVLNATSESSRVTGLRECVVHVAIRDFEASDWELARRYIYPGDSW